MTGICSIPDCGERHHALGMCSTHYSRVRRTGDPGATDIKGRNRTSTLRLQTCSYFDYKPEMGRPVRISLGRPRYGFTSEEPLAYLSPLTPRRQYFHDPAEEFARKFLEQLDSYGPQRLWEMFQTLHDGRPLVLLCFERNAVSGADCHRRRFAEYWLEQTGEHIPEIGGSR